MRGGLALAGLALLGACQRASAPPTQQAMNVAAQASAQESDRALQALYDGILPRLADDDRTLLRAAEQAWITYRDRNCEAETALYEGGSAAPLMHFGCLAANTQARVAELRRIYGEQLGLD